MFTELARCIKHYLFKKRVLTLFITDFYANIFQCYFNAHKVVCYM